MSSAFQSLVKCNYFSIRRETVGNATNSVRYFQGCNTLLTTLNGPEHSNTNDMNLITKVIIQPRNDIPNFVYLKEKICPIGRKNKRTFECVDLH